MMRGTVIINIKLIICPEDTETKFTVKEKYIYHRVHYNVPWKISKNNKNHLKKNISQMINESLHWWFQNTISRAGENNNMLEKKITKKV